MHLVSFLSLKEIVGKYGLPSGHRMLISALYNPPKHNYQECDLMSHIINFLDNTLDKDPNTVFVCGGDLNLLDLNRLQSMSGWKALVDFPTRGDACLDNCLTNRPDLFNKCHPFQLSIKTDHTAVILPAGTKLKPIRCKVQIRDCRENRKATLYTALAEENWDNVLAAPDVQQAVCVLEEKIRGHMDRCMPVKTVSMSSRDPPWMTPLLKSMIRTKSRVSRLSKDRLCIVNKRIADIISENRRKFMDAPPGSRAWWKGVDELSQRRRASCKVNLDNSCLMDLNDYFARLCSDDMYIEPTPVTISSEGEIPLVSERQVWNLLSALKRTATGPDQIPYWVWKEHAEIFTPLITKIWNLSISTQCLPSSWKRAIITPLPKVDVPEALSDYCGIHITPVIARAFEKIVYH